MSNGSPPTRDTLDNKANQLFAGKVVRKDPNPAFSSEVSHG
jgi:ATP-dependent Lon protease